MLSKKRLVIIKVIQNTARDLFHTGELRGCLAIARSVDATILVKEYLLPSPQTLLQCSRNLQRHQRRTQRHWHRLAVQNGGRPRRDFVDKSHGVSLVPARMCRRLDEAVAVTQLQCAVAWMQVDRYLARGPKDLGRVVVAVRRHPGVVEERNPAVPVLADPDGIVSIAFGLELWVAGGDTDRGN